MVHKGYTEVLARQDFSNFTASSQTLNMQIFSNYLFQEGLLFLFHMFLFINSSPVTILMRLVIQENSIPVICIGSSGLVCLISHGQIEPHA
jgi:hypothetical protein